MEAYKSTFTGYFDKLNQKICLGNKLLRNNGSVFEVIQIINEFCIKKINDEICPEIRLNSDTLDKIWDDIVILQ